MPLKPKSVSIIVPTLNEAGNIELLLQRLNMSLSLHKIDYEVIFVDDHSTDLTKSEVEKYTETYPVSFYEKIGNKGKAYSLLEGFSYAKYDILAFLDADLQYPPEAIAKMVELIVDGDSDIVITDRIEKNLSFKRKVLSKGFRFIFGRLLHGLNYDIQSGQKVFKKEVLSRIHLAPSPWTFDLEFLLQSRNAGYKISSVEIDFSDRYSGSTKIKVFQSTWEIGVAALKLKFKDMGSVMLPFVNKETDELGFHNKGNKYLTHTTLHHSQTAVRRLSLPQHIVFFSILGIALLFLIFNFHQSMIVFVSIISALYLLDLFFYLHLTYKSFFDSREIKISSEQIKNYTGEWPMYSIFCPLYKEAEILPQFVQAMSKLDYPTEKLDIMLVLEEDDKDTIQAAYDMNLPSHIRVVVVPHGKPKTKPKACNYALLKAKGEYIVIYDAEDIPESTQIKKAVIAFQTISRDIFCIQAKLNFYNSTQNLLTRMFTGEYSTWFDLMLTGLHSIKAPIPLGGTSNHFRKEDLMVLEGWDPFNVTEDADLGMRIVKRGYRTAILDSTTMEEANSEYKNWIKQRSRWIKGYIQTYFVHMRNPMDFFKSNRGIDLFTFQLIIGGKVFLAMVNPIMWLLTLSYILLNPLFGPFIQSLYYGATFYIAAITLILGNFLYSYYYVVGCAKREQWHLIPYVVIVPFYWLMMSIAAYYAVWEFIVRPFHWNKTKHGLHLKVEKQEPEKDLLIK